MVNYKNGKIYKIINDVNDKFYIGSTSEPYLSNRMASHRKKHNMCMSKNIGVDLKQCSIILIENYPCNDKQELLRKEREYFDKYKKECKEVFINKRKPTYYEGEKKQLKKEYDKEYLKNNKDKIKEYLKNNKEIRSEKRKEYIEKNKELVKEKRKKYHEKNKEQLNKQCLERYRNKDKNTPEYKEFKEKRKKYLKEYHQNNKDKIKEYLKNNKDKIKEREYKIVKCECGCEIIKKSLPRHKKSKKHIKLIQSLYNI